jgi:hypothetical protein
MRSYLASLPPHLRRSLAARLARPRTHRLSLGLGVTIALIVSVAMWAAIIFGALAFLGR